tara:strand:+ start:1015 stop:1515 length:501 start_codon:yes stop_codon:yes gene_type:complete
MNNMSVSQLEAEANLNMPTGVEFKFVSHSVDKHGFSLAFKSHEGQHQELVYSCPCDEKAIKIALEVADALVSKYQYSHRCVQESAEKMRARMIISVKVDKKELESVLGLSATEKLEREIGRSITECHRFPYQSVTGETKQGYVASIMNEDFIFVVENSVSHGGLWN